MMRLRAVPAAVVCGTLLSAAGAFAQAAEPFPVVPTAPPERVSHFWANAALLAGAALIGASFSFEHQADLTYDHYLVAIEPSRITTLYDRTVSLDRDSGAALLAGNALVAGGLYLHFVRRPHAVRLALAVDARRCAVLLSF
jgi:hypothetical protein